METKPNSTILCPCGRGSSYGDCCERVHLSHSSARTAEELMRSRYSAYALGKVDFLVQSHHPRTRSKKLKKDITDWINEVEFEFLEVLEVEPDSVTFLVGFQTPSGQSQIRQEHSRFVQEKGLWYYLDSDLD